MLDEVLAVGDVGFRAKCQAHIGEMREAGTSLVLASHSMDEIVSNCRWAVWLDRGAVRAFGERPGGPAALRGRRASRTLARTPEGLGEGRIGSLEVEVASAVGVNDGARPRSGDDLRSGDAAHADTGAPGRSASGWPAPSRC